MVYPFSPISYEENKYILVVIDNFPNFIDLFVGSLRHPTREPLPVPTSYLTFFYDIDLPRNSCSIGVQNFPSNVVSELLSIFHARQMTASRYDPQTKGKNEALHRTSLSQIKIYMSSPDKADWDELPPCFAYALNSAPLYDAASPLLVVLATAVIPKLHPVQY